MGQPVPLALPTLWVLGCFSLLLWLWVLCTACHRTRVLRHRARLQGSMKPVQVQVRHQAVGAAPRPTQQHPPRPASMDLLHPHWLEVPRSSTRPQAAPSIFPPQQLPKASPVSPSPFIGPEDTYSNIGLAAIPRASLASSPVVWAGTRLTIGCARPGPAARPLVAEYACIQKLKGTGQGPQELQQGTAERIPTAQVDILYSRVCKSESRDPGLIKNQLDLKGGGSILAPRNDLTCETLPLRDLSMDSRPLENVYESIQEMGP
ncbi:lck-interacting transmembrane adapter 1 isoform X2 [Marmota marmota marmota]|uniref:lck-interacting transmembrane adapter 1 isoform X2 n=1 Tax=Marmota marmota marmota TaxID=9994 RepID=UPI000762AE1A|nr:lck-interacting transmembrane adapter 1 isoform X2 [Marmota marmota marmota]XP_015333746.1 lck-interacting transmembrane adapter 1 isoform X2 [Marmota marmota marmota]XP_048666569.1 lck-interacting transmembrane adapter 1 isoform X2 [Marmota marmota marmota]